MPKPKKTSEVDIYADAMVGKKVPAFSLPISEDKKIKPADYAGAPWVLYFYPKDNTSGCTQQACDFNDALPKFSKLGVPVVGVSKDSLKSHGKFIEKFGLKFPLAADEDSAVMEKFGVWKEKSMYGRKYMGAERSTFLIDAEGKIRAVWRKVSVPNHIESVLHALKTL